MKPYYQDSHVTIYHGDCREFDFAPGGRVMVSDPPFGIGYTTGWKDAKLPRRIANDHDTTLRDEVLARWGDRPALIFGSWRVPRPANTRMLLIWDTKGALGMGDLSLPWKPSHQEIYVLGSGFVGHRGSDVLRFAPVQAKPGNGRTHPTEKPIALMRDLVRKCDPSLTVLDPFCGTGSTIVAAKSEGRTAIGIEIEERYCEIAAKRLSQEVLDLGSV